MWQFDYPWVFLLLPLAWLAYRMLGVYQESRSAVRVPFFSAMSRAVGKQPGDASASGGRGQLLLNLDTRGHIRDNKAAHFQVTLKVGFRIANS